MKRSRFTEEQITFALRQAEAAARGGRPRDPEEGSTAEPAVGDGLHA